MAGFPLSNVTTADAYTPGNESIMDPPRTEPTMIVTGNSVYYQTQIATGLRGAGGQWTQEVLVPPGRYSFTPADFPPGGRCSGIRVRSGLAGFAAQVTIH